MSFTQEQIGHLNAPLDRGNVKDRQQAGRTFSYVEGWHVIAEANRIFGFDAWDRETSELRCLGERQVGDKARVAYMARVRVTVRPADGPAVVRDGCGFGSGIDKDIGQAHESALKEAETDAMKRALSTFGNPFGLALYDKTQANVVGESEPTAPGRPKNGAALHANGKPIDLSVSQRLAQNMMASLWKVRGEGVLDVTEDERFIRDLKVLEPEDAKKVQDLVHERRAIQ